MDTNDLQVFHSYSSKPPCTFQDCFLPHLSWFIIQSSNNPNAVKYELLKVSLNKLWVEVMAMLQQFGLFQMVTVKRNTIWCLKTRHWQVLVVRILHPWWDGWSRTEHFSTSFWAWANAVMTLQCQQNYVVHCNIWMASWPLFDTRFTWIFFFFFFRKQW